MKLKTLEMENIRSYKQARIDFPDGVVLFEGDIGSGKSTILYAIEFALFGLGDLKSGFLLRNDASEGFVRLELEATGKQIAVERRLERKNGKAGQGPGWVIEDGVKTEYAPEELKKKVLQLLEFNENPSPKSTSWIYRYAVFTPQEEMKAILALKDEERLQTLRKAFGIEEYKQARENAGVLSKRIKARCDFLEGAVAELGALREKKEETEKALNDLRSKTNALKAVEEGKRRELSEAEARAKELADEKTRLQELSARLPLLESELKEKKSGLVETGEEIQALEENSKQIEEQISQMKVVEEIGDEKTIRLAVQDARKKVEEKQKECDRLESKAGDFEKLVKEKQCPTCAQEIPAGDFAGKISDLKKQLKGKHAELDKLKHDEDNASKKLEDFFNQNAAKGILQDLRKEVLENKSKVRDLSEKKKKLEERIPVLEKEVAATRQGVEAGKGLQEKIKGGEAELRLKKSELEKAVGERSRSEAELQASEKNEAELGKQVAVKEKQETELNALVGKRNWLDEVFAPGLESVEKHVLGAINSEFNSVFQKHFATLIESSELSAFADDKFTPVVSLNGYEEDYRVLSGGEKSALALAYRLALNEVVRANCASMKENLLILDEPTDGFSKEQLHRLRDVLNEVDVKQVLLVSHERELESFADRVFHVSKQGSVSAVSG
ncbi:MAG: AAA family ATPase [Candidatus Micrarchaeota archaeon]